MGGRLEGVETLLGRSERGRFVKAPLCRLINTLWKRIRGYWKPSDIYSKYMLFSKLPIPSGEFVTGLLIPSGEFVTVLLIPSDT